MLRNREPIAEVLGDWLPERGLVLEIASGTGEHVVFFAERFPRLEWQPWDAHRTRLPRSPRGATPAALANVRAPVELDACAPEWPIGVADAVLNINMVHISPWASALGLLDGASRVLGRAAADPLRPWLKAMSQTAPSNLAFDQDLKSRDPDWGLRRVEDFAAAAASAGSSSNRPGRCRPTI